MPTNNTDVSGNTITKDASGNTVITDASGKSVTKDASGNIITKDASGNIITKDASGNIITKDASGNTITKDASGNTITKDASGNTITKDASGNTITKDASGNTITKDASGNIIKKDASGNTITKDASGNTIIKDASGNTITKDASGNIVIKDASGNIIKKDVPNKNITAHQIIQKNAEAERLRRLLDGSRNTLFDYKNDLDKPPQVKVDASGNIKTSNSTDANKYVQYMDASYNIYDSSTDYVSDTGITKQVVNIIILSITVLFVVILLFSALISGFLSDFIVGILLIAFVFVLTVIQNKEYQKNYMARLLIYWRIQIDDHTWIYLILSMVVFTLIQLYFSFNQESKSISSHFFYIFFLFFTIFMVFLFACRKIFSLDLSKIVFEKLYNAWFELSNKEIDFANLGKIDDGTENVPDEDNSDKDKDKDKSKGKDIVGDAEVFNISNNMYTYEDAQSVCKLYNGRLATYQEIEKSYENGGEFCNYGWSDSQMILFPTQQKTWDALQKTKNHNMCGRPGINGGYMSDKNAKFGVNCYAVKPKAKSSDQIKNIVQVPQDEETKKKVKYWQDNSDTLLNINAFNYSRWNE